MADISTIPKYSLCPGVPELSHKCFKRKLSARDRCQFCEKVFQTGKLPKVRRKCLGVQSVGHFCSTWVLTRVRCRVCTEIYNKYQDTVDGLRRQKIERVCLRCSRKFTASNRFYRLCKGCRSENGTVGYEDTRYSINLHKRTA